MQIDTALEGVSLLFLDTAPIIYAVEQNPDFEAVVTPIFDRLDSDILAVISPITLSECLVYPLKMGSTELEQAYLRRLSQPDVIFVNTTTTIARDAARIRATYNLQLTDSLQLATAINASCNAFLTNDRQLKRVSELNVLVVSELET